MWGQIEENMDRSLTRLQVLIIDAIVTLGARAYCNNIRAELTRRTGREFAQGYVHAMLQRLIQRGCLVTTTQTGMRVGAGRVRSVPVYVFTKDGFDLYQRSKIFFAPTQEAPQ